MTLCAILLSTPPPHLPPTETRLYTHIHTHTSRGTSRKNNFQLNPLTPQWRDSFFPRGWWINSLTPLYFWPRSRAKAWLKTANRARKLSERLSRWTTVPNWFIKSVNTSACWTLNARVVDTIRERFRTTKGGRSRRGFAIIVYGKVNRI